MPRRPIKALESPQDFAALLERAQKIAPQLGAATDELNQSIIRFEQALAGLHLGVSAYIELGREPIYDGNNMEAGEHIEQITFSKTDGAWRLRYENGTDGDEPEHWRSVHLVSAPREVRMRAVDHLPRMLQEMIDEAENATTRVTAKAKKLDTVTTLINAAKNSGAK